MIDACRRVFDRASTCVWARRADILGAAIPVAVLLIAFSPVLFGGRTLSTASYSVGSNGFGPFPGQRTVDEPRHYQLDTGASAWQFEPWAEATSRIVSDGDLPLWDPYSSSGAPLAANMQSAPFDPLFAMVNLHPTTWTWDMTLIACFALAAVATYVFARVVGLGYLGAVTASVAYGLSGFFFLYSNNHFSVVFVYLPILLLLCEWVVRSARLIAVFVLALATASCIAVGMPEIQILVLLSAGGYGLWRCFVGPRVVRARTSVLFLLAGFGLGAGMAAPLLLPFGEFESLSFNAHKSTDKVGELTDPFQYVLGWIFPFLDGFPMLSTSAGMPSGTRDWVGGAVTMLAVVGAASRRTVARVLVPFFGVAIVLVFAKVYGLPVVRWVGRLPLLELVNFPRYALPVAAMGMAVLAGTGVDAIRHRAIHVTRLVVLTVLAVGLFAVAMFEFRDTLHLIPGTQVLKEIGIGVGGVLAVVAAMLIPRIRPAAYAATAVVILEVLVLVPNADAYPLRADPYHEPTWLTASRAELVEHPYDRVFGLDALLFPNTAAAFGLYDIRALDALYVDRYWRYIQTFIEPQVYSRFVGGPYGVDDETTLANYQGNPMFDLLGVRYLFARHPIAGRSTSPTDGTRQWKFLTAAEGVQMFENEDVAPRAFVATDVRAVPDLDAATALFESHSTPFADGALNVTGFDPQVTAVVEAAPDDVPGLVSGVSCPSQPEAKIEAYDADRVQITVDSACPGLLVLSDTYFPGWTASVNGRNETIYPTDLALRGVPVPAGHSEIVMTYAPGTFRTGLALSFVAFLVLPLVALIRWALR